MKANTIKSIPIQTLLTAALVLCGGQVFAHCETEGRDSASSGVIKEQWGESTEVTKAGRLYFSGQPDDEALQRSAEQGIDIVISLRGESESTYEEAEVVRNLGMEFHRIPVDGSADVLAPEPFSKITEVVLSNPDADILVHCSSGNRASAWYATYLALVKGVDTDQAIVAADHTGLTNKGLEEKVRAFLETRE